MAVNLEECIAITYFDDKDESELAFHMKTGNKLIVMCGNQVLDIFDKAVAALENTNSWVVVKGREDCSTIKMSPDDMPKNPSLHERNNFANK